MTFGSVLWLQAAKGLSCWFWHGSEQIWGQIYSSRGNCLTMLPHSSVVVVLAQSKWGGGGGGGPRGQVPDWGHVLSPPYRTSFSL